MNVIKIRNVHRALPLAMQAMKATGVRRDSRNGPVLQAPGGVTTVYERPTERVMFWAERDGNPYFHFFENLWMLGGKYDVKSVARFVGGMARYSDDGETFHGTYGRRWRVSMPADVQYGPNQAPFDQLTKIINILRSNKDDRRCVLQMWDSASDLGSPSKDVPCNTTATFQVGVDGRLDMAVFNRSNDIIWGCYGANAVHFSGLQEYVARFAGLRVGTYSQISMNWHAYVDVFDNLWAKFQKTVEAEFDPNISPEVADLSDTLCPYGTEQVKPYPMIHETVTQEEWDIDLANLLRYGGRAPTLTKWTDSFFPEVAVPILKSHDCFKQIEGEQRYQRALKELEACRATDWRLACQEWISRRYTKWIDNDGKE